MVMVGVEAGHMLLSVNWRENCNKISWHPQGMLTLERSQKLRYKINRFANYAVQLR